MTNEKILAEIKKNCAEIDGKYKLPCAVAFKLAEELQIGLKEITNICNAHKIKVNKCQLGCFE